MAFPIRRSSISYACLFVVSLLSGCQTPYRDRENGFSITPPAGWTQTAPGTALYVLSKDDGRGRIEVFRHDLDDGTTLVEFFTKRMPEVESGRSLKLIENEADRRPDGLKFLRATYTLEKGGEPFKCMTLVTGIPKDDPAKLCRVFTVVCSAPEDSFGAFEEDFEEATRSFSIEKPTLSFISNNTAEFWTIARRGTEKAEQDFYIDCEFRMPAFGTAAEQYRFVEDLIAKGATGFAVSPNDAHHQKRVFNKLFPDDVYFMTQDSDLPPGSNRMFYIGTDNIRAGWAVGKLAMEALGDRKGKVMIFVGDLDVQNAQERRQGVIAALAGLSQDEAKSARAKKIAAPSVINGLSDGRYDLLGTKVDEVSKDKCIDNAEDTLNKYTDVNCMIGLWAYNPPAILKAVHSSERAKEIVIIGFDEDEETLQGIIDGHIYATVVQDPYNFGYETMHILQHKIRFGTLPGLIEEKAEGPDGRMYFVPHRVIRLESAVKPGQLFNEDVYQFREDLRRKKGG